MVQSEAPVQESDAARQADAVARLRALGGPLFDAFSASGAALCVSDPSRTGEPIVFANAAFEALTGHKAVDLAGQSARILLSDASDPAVVAALEEDLERTKSARSDIQLRHGDGTPFWCRLAVTRLVDEVDQTAFHLSILSPIPPEQIEPHPPQEAAGTGARLGRPITGGAGAWEWDIASNVLVADVRFAALYGLDPAKAAAGLPASAFYEPMHPDDVLRMKIAVAGMMNGAEVFARDYRIVGPDGALRWVSARGRTWLDEGDRPIRFSGVLADITDQKRVEERLRVAQSAGGVGTFEYLSGFGTVEVSEQFCRLLGLHPADSLPVRTINSLVHADDPPLIGNWSEADVTQKAVRIRRANDGQERWLTVRGEHQAHAAGDGGSFTGVIYDVTDAKLAEARLRILTESLEESIVERTQERDRIWNLSRDLLFVASNQGRFTALNPAWSTVLGKDHNDLLGAMVTALIHPDDAEAARSHLRAAASQGIAAEFDCRMLGPDGDWRWISWTVTGEAGAIFGSGRDLTQRRALEDQLRQSQKMEAVGQLTGGIAHDFNNMLTGILGGIDMVRKRLQTGRPQDAERFLEAASQSGQRAAALTHRLLAFSRRQSLDTRATDVGALVASMSELMSRTMGEQVVVETSLPAELWHAAADPSQLESAILNLAINARDAMPRGGRLAISVANRTLGASDLDPAEAAKPGEYVEVSVSDTGMGMSRDVVAKVFEPFYTTKPIGQGTGLGLSMIYGYMQQLNGAVRIDSLEGKGTTVRLLLPRHSGAVETPSAPAGTPQQGRGETVLVVEDDPSVRLLVLQVLQELGYRGLEAPDADHALPLLASQDKIDLLVTDVGLPGLNGRQLAEIARESRPGLPVLFITGYALAAVDQTTFLDAGMQMITKPFDIDELGHRIGAMIAPSLN
ncbi:PAS domain-containing protein [Caulobacter segnis]|uniref:hybrid sensor histidine kinase/response regulator n=1 Tax=Caulobacter segnis TaxID=88688 RepID=UPI0024106CF2|nr:PAS domain-containing protein [Caulobacter segnis]MDG2522120.1 PAS domain-containing protein [Caulobacter segnis]